jgi:4-diphosphocytidyl-2-C-methyl-D-erythritol kinase
MTALLTETARAKINLTLRVVGCRADGYHDLESLVAFADVADTLTLDPGADLGLEVSGPFAAVSGDTADNLVLKVHAALSADVAGLKAGHFALEKNLTVAAGIGGGSADAAAALRLLARVNELAFDDARLMTAALKVGADVPVCLASRACVMTGVGERLTPPLDLPKLPAVLVNPGVPLATRDVFSAYASRAAAAPSLGNIPRQPGALIEFLKTHGNDLTEAAIVRAPAVGEVLNALAALPGVQLARMSGSGSTCFALFGSSGEAAAGAARLAAERQDWWVVATHIG